MTLHETARGLRELIEAEADAIETAGTMSARIVDALEGAGLFNFMTPKSLGGHEATPSEIFDVCEELSYADGSVGWAFAQNTAVGSYLAFVSPVAAKRFADLRAGAGMFAPLGIAHQTDGGYMISGNYKFGSGSGHAQFMGGAALVMRDGEMAPMAADGTPPIIGFLVPPDGFKLKGNWDVMGLRGTGSYDFEIPEQHVPADTTWTMFQPGAASRQSGGPLYGIGPIPLATIGSVAWAVGVARRALTEVRDIAKNGRARLGQTPLIEQQPFQRDYGQHATAVDAARTHALHTYELATAAIEANHDTEQINSCLRATKVAANYTTKVAVEAVDFAWGASGSDGMRNPSRIQRCFRDIHMGAGHMVFDDRNYIEFAKEHLHLETTFI
ncbi:acyl-CoA dehydrogenase family protein [Mycobacterium sp.]|uniref:acyl-CoA dehydrogenase family protein n=1 Tax=Mycobacterium sp. TaxID=1785 RepID=UPI003BAA7C36